MHTASSSKKGHQMNNTRNIMLPVGIILVIIVSILTYINFAPTKDVKKISEGNEEVIEAYNDKVMSGFRVKIYLNNIRDISDVTFSICVSNKDGYAFVDANPTKEEWSAFLKVIKDKNSDSHIKDSSQYTISVLTDSFTEKISDMIFVEQD